MRQSRSTTSNKRSPLTTMVALIGLVGVVALGVFLLSGAGLSLSALATPTVSADGSGESIQPLAPGSGPVNIVWSGSPTVDLNATVNLSVIIQAGAQEVDTVGAYISFDPARLDVAIPTAGTTFNTTLQNSRSNASGTITFAAGSLPPADPDPEDPPFVFPSGTFTLFTTTFTAQQCGDAVLTFQFDGAARETDALRSSASVLNQAVNGLITVAGPGCATATPTSTNTVVANTATNTATSTNTVAAPTATNTSTNTPSQVPPTATNTSTNTPSQVPPTATNTSTNTPSQIAPTATNTSTATASTVPNTATNTATATASTVPNTATNTSTATSSTVPNTATNTATATNFVTNTWTPTFTAAPPTSTPTNTNTAAPPTATATQTQTFTAAPPTETSAPSATPSITNTPTEGPSPTPSNTLDPSLPTAAPPTGTPVPAEYVVCDNISERTGGAIVAAGGGGIAVIRDTSNTTVAAAGRAKLLQEVGNAYCRPIAVEDVYVTSPEEIGDPGVVSMPVANAVDIFGLLADGTPANTFIRVMQVCFRSTSGELLLFADSAGVPRSYVPLTTYISGEYICGFIGRGGTVVQVDLPN